MAYLEWRKELNTGIAIIDEQHKLIVDYINRFQDAIDTGDTKEIETLFDELVDYTVTHFTFEENLQEKAGYELRAGHQRIHQLFTKKVQEFRDRFEAGDVEAPNQVADMLRSWLVNHIQNNDADYVPAVKKVIQVEEQSGWIGRTVKRLFGRRPAG